MLKYIRVIRVQKYYWCAKNIRVIREIRVQKSRVQKIIIRVQNNLFVFKIQNSKLESRFPQVFHDHSDLLCQQIFCLFSVAGLVEVVHQRFATVDPSHQVVHRHMWVAVGKIEHGQFCLAV